VRQGASLRLCAVPFLYLATSLGEALQTSIEEYALKKTGQRTIDNLIAKTRGTR
jgi:hypothetical protein